MARPTPRFGTFALAAFTAIVLWLIAHGRSDIERSLDIPVAFSGIPADLVVTGQSASVVNIRLLGSRAALRNVSATQLEYAVDVSDAKPGPAVYEVDESQIDERLPRQTRIVSRSPASIEVSLELRGRRAVLIRPDVEGEPAEGYVLSGVEVEPPRVWLAGARSDVLRLSEVATETIPVAGLTGPVEREVRLSLGEGHVWREEKSPVKVRLQIEPAPQAAPAAQGGT